MKRRLWGKISNRPCEKRSLAQGRPAPIGPNFDRSGGRRGHRATLSACRGFGSRPTARLIHARRRIRLANGVPPRSAMSAWPSRNWCSCASSPTASTVLYPKARSRSISHGSSTFFVATEAGCVTTRLSGRACSAATTSWQRAIERFSPCEACQRLTCLAICESRGPRGGMRTDVPCGQGGRFTQASVGPESPSWRPSDRARSLTSTPAKQGLANSRAMPCCCAWAPRRAPCRRWCRSRRENSSGTGPLPPPSGSLRRERLPSLCRQRLLG